MLGEAKGSSWLQTTLGSLSLSTPAGALAAEQEGWQRTGAGGCPPNQGWWVPEVGSAAWRVWKGMGQPAKL